MVSAMKDVVQRGTAASSVGSQIRFPAGGKTGTTNDGQNVWFIGYTSDLVAGVWIGFDRPKRIKANAQGGILAAPAWSAFMNQVYSKRRSPADWPAPPNIVTRRIDVTTNMLASPYCPLSVVSDEVYIPGTDPIYVCDVHSALPSDTNAAGYPPGSLPVVDSVGRIVSPPMGGTVIPMLPAPARPRDTLRVDSASNDSSRRAGTSVIPRRDSLGRVRPDTTARRPDTTIRRPDTTIRRPDTTRPPVVRPDTTRAGSRQRV